MLKAKSMTYASSLYLIFTYKNAKAMIIPITEHNQTNPTAAKWKVFVVYNLNGPARGAL